MNKTKNLNTYILNENEIKSILDILSKEYSDAKCGLDYNNALELTIALILAAQCTDKRVNIIRPILFERYPDVQALAKASQEDVEEIIQSCGFYKNKAKNIISTANVIVDSFNGNVPYTMEHLTTLPGIGRKSANIILQECFDTTVGIAIDTHVGRITKRIGLTNNTDPIKIEQDLMNLLPKEMWNKINHLCVWHGRAICDAKKPKCDECPIKEICKYQKK